MCHLLTTGRRRSILPLSVSYCTDSDLTNCLNVICFYWWLIINIFLDYEYFLVKCELLSLQDVFCRWRMEGGGTLHFNFINSSSMSSSQTSPKIGVSWGMTHFEVCFTCFQLADTTLSHSQRAHVEHSLCFFFSLHFWRKFCQKPETSSYYVRTPEAKAAFAALIGEQRRNRKQLSKKTPESSGSYQTLPSK